MIIDTLGEFEIIRVRDCCCYLSYKYIIVGVVYDNDYTKVHKDIRAWVKHVQKRLTKSRENAVRRIEEAKETLAWIDDVEKGMHDEF